MGDDKEEMYYAQKRRGPGMVLKTLSGPCLAGGRLLGAKRRALVVVGGHVLRTGGSGYGGHQVLTPGSPGGLVNLQPKT